jgi:hypothetical protein
MCVRRAALLIQHRITKDSKALVKAAELLEDNNLVWDNDFENIRLDLARSMRSAAGMGAEADAELIKLARKLTKGK